MDTETNATLSAFIAAHGPAWKDALGIAWGKGTDTHFPNGHNLRALRNSPAYGHAWLDVVAVDCFAICTAHYEALQASAQTASDAFRLIPGIGSGPMGLTPDHIKFAMPYREAKAAYDGAAKRLKTYAAKYVKWFKKELAAARNARRAMGSL